MTPQNGKQKWLSGWFADEIERHIAGVVDGKVGVFMRPEQWRAAIARLRELRSDGEEVEDKKP